MVSQPLPRLALTLVLRILEIGKSILDFVRWERGIEGGGNHTVEFGRPPARRPAGQGENKQQEGTRRTALAIARVARGLAAELGSHPFDHISISHSLITAHSPLQITTSKMTTTLLACWEPHILPGTKTASGIES